MYILYIVRANFVLIPVKKAERNFEIAARTLCLRVCGATPHFTAAVKIPLPRQHFSSRILFDRKLSKAISSDYGSNKERNVHLEMRNLKQTELHRLKNRGKKG